MLTTRSLSISVLEIVTPEKRAFATSIRYIFWMAGMLLAVGAAYLFRNWRTFLLIIATPTVLNAILLLWVSDKLCDAEMAWERFPYYGPVWWESTGDLAKSQPCWATIFSNNRVAGWHYVQGSELPTSEQCRNESTNVGPMLAQPETTIQAQRSQLAGMFCSTFANLVSLFQWQCSWNSQYNTMTS